MSQASVPFIIFLFSLLRRGIKLESEFSSLFITVLSYENDFLFPYFLQETDFAMLKGGFSQTTWAI